MRPLALLLAAVLAQDPAPRAARSVHLRWDAPESSDFYHELRVEESVPGSYFMACGWNTGYFGMQELSGAKEPRKIVLFSVWDPTKGDDASKVPLEKRVEVLDGHPDAKVGRFGGEGTGGQCKYPYAWSIGETCRFLVRAAVDGDKTAYTGFFYRNDAKAWVKLVTFRVTTGGKPLGGLYSFVEDFRRDGKSVQERRRAVFGNGWVKPLAGDWKAVAKARFTADGTKLDNIHADAVDGRFNLGTGGDLAPTVKLDASIVLPEAARSLPSDRP